MAGTLFFESENFKRKIICLQAREFSHFHYIRIFTTLAFSLLSRFAFRDSIFLLPFCTFSLSCSPLTTIRVLRSGKVDANQAIFRRSYEIRAFRRESTRMRKTAKKFLFCKITWEKYAEARFAEYVCRYVLISPAVKLFAK